MEKTAVEWLLEKLIETHTNDEWKAIIKQAKKMEKQQLNDAYNSDRPNLTCYEENTAFKEYYKRNF